MVAPLYTASVDDTAFRVFSEHFSCLHPTYLHRFCKLKREKKVSEGGKMKM